MKKYIAIALALTLALCLCACTGEKPQETTAAPETTPAAEVPETTAAPEVPETTAAPQETEAVVVADKDFALTFNGVKLTPGDVYNGSALPQPLSVYQVPSCAIEGTDNVYSFTELDITAFHDGTQEIIYAITIYDPNFCTDEGLYLGDDAARVVELYGEHFIENGTAMVYTGPTTTLTIILQNGFVTSIEFGWITE
jgi:hypothetical protein